MKAFRLIFVLAILAAFVFKGYCEATNEVSKPASSRPSLVSRTTSNSGGLTEDELAGLASKWSDEKNSAHEITLTADIYQKKFDPKKDKSQIRKFAKSGKVPFKIYIELHEQNIDGKGKIASKLILDQKAYFYLTDPDNKIVLKQSQGLNSLCPS